MNTQIAEWSVNVINIRKKISEKQFALNEDIKNLLELSQEETRFDKIMNLINWADVLKNRVQSVCSEIKSELYRNVRMVTADVDKKQNEIDEIIMMLEKRITLEGALNGK